MSSAAVLAKTVLLSLTDESRRRKIGWVLAAIFSPVILVVALLCCLLGGTSEHNSSMVELCFHGGALPESVPAEYRIYMEDMQSSFSRADFSSLVLHERKYLRTKYIILYRLLALESVRTGHYPEKRL